MSVHGICPKCLDYAFDDELCKCLGCGYQLVEEKFTCGEPMRVKVYYKEILAGILEKRDEDYLFIYDKDFLKHSTPISISLPLREEPYYSKELFPFFKGLLPEGWYLEIVSKTQKVDAKDYFGLLVSTSSMDSIGAVTVKSGAIT